MVDQEAYSQSCSQITSSGVFDCSGTILTGQTISAEGSSNIVTILDKSATVNVESGIGFSLLGARDLTFFQEAGGGNLNGGTNATGVIHAKTSGSGDISVLAVGAITLAGSGSAIKTETDGTGNIHIKTANVTASHSGGTAIEVVNNGANVSISAGTIVGGVAGVVLKTSKSGSTFVNVSGDIRSKSGKAIAVYAESGDTAVRVSGAIASSGSTGLYLTQGRRNEQSYGSVSVSTGDISGRKGIHLQNFGEGNTSINVNGLISGSSDKALAVYSDEGHTSISVSGRITSSTDTALYVSQGRENVVSSGNFSITTNDIRGKDGIIVKNNGAGGSIKVSGTVSSSDGKAIAIYDSSSGTFYGMSISTSGNVTAVNGDGIYVESKNSGSINVTISGDVTAHGTGSRVGINVNSSNSGSANVVINKGSVSATGFSIKNGDGESNITVNSSGEIKSGVSLQGGDDNITFNGSNPNSSTKDFYGGAGTDVITFKNLSGAIDFKKFKQWEVVEFGSGASITFSSSQTLSFSRIRLVDGGGLRLQDGQPDDILTISGALSGIGTFTIDTNLATGATDKIVISGNFQGTHTLKVNNVAENSAVANATSIDVLSVTGTTNSSVLTLDGTSSFKGYLFDLEFDESSPTKVFRLVSTRRSVGCVKSTLNTGNVFCSGVINTPQNLVVDGVTPLVVTLDDSATVNVNTGIAFLMSGTNSVSFKQETGGGSLEGGAETTGVIHAKTTGNGNLSINAVGSIRFAGSGVAVKAESTGTGNVTVSTANVTASNSSGTAIQIEGKGATVHLKAGTILGRGSGVVFKNTGDGTSNITINGSVTSYAGNALDVYAKSGNTRTSVYGAITTSSNTAFHLVQGKRNVKSSGNVAITVGDVSGEKGLVAINYGDGEMQITVTGNVRSTAISPSRSAGIVAANYGVGNVTVNLSSGASVHGSKGVSIFGSNGTTTLNATGNITAVNGDGIDIKSRNSGAINVTISGNVTAGGKGPPAGINVNNSEGGVATININSGTIASSGYSITNDEGKIEITVNSNGKINSGVSLQGGDDKITFNGSNPNASTKDFFGGAGTDVVTFKNLSSAVDFTKFKQWEEIVFGSGTAIVNNSSQTLTFPRVRFSDGGGLTLQDGQPDDILTISGALSGIGTFTIDTNLATGATDKIVISGNFQGTHTLKVNNVAENSAVANATSIDVLSVTGTTNSSVLTLDGTSSFKGYLFDLEFDESSPTKVFRLVSTRRSVGCVKSTLNTGNVFCSGVINTPQNLVVDGVTPLVVTLDDSATVNVNTGIAFLMSGTNSVSFKQETGGGSLEGGAETTGVIHAKTTGNGNLSINAVGSIRFAGSGVAVKAESTGTGNVTVSTANVTASNSSGTAIQIEGKGATVHLKAGTILGRGSGVVFKNTGDGTSNITINGSVTSYAGNALDVYAKSGNTRTSVYGAITTSSNTAFHLVQGKRNVKSSGNVAITVGDVSGEKGLVAINYGDGEMQITVTGNVRSTAISPSRSAGIVAANYGVGNVTVNLSSGASVHGSKGVSIFGSNGTTTLNATGNITAVNGDGIDIKSRNSGAIKVTISGNVTANGEGSHAGINVNNSEGGVATINVKSGTIEASGYSIANDEGKTEITVNANGKIVSGVSLQGGDDKITFNGSNPNSSTKDFYGGSGTDVVTFKNLSSAVDFSKFKQWEVVEFGSGASITFSSSQTLSFPIVRFLDGGGLTLQDGQPDDILTISGAVEGNGTFKIDTNLATGTSDKIVISGDFDGTHTISINNITPSNADVNATSIDVLSVTGTTSSNALTLNGTPEFKGYVFDLKYFGTGSNKVFRLVSTRGSSECIRSTQNIGNYTCSGLIESPQRLVNAEVTALSATLASDQTVVTVSSLKAFILTSNGSVAFTQSASGGPIRATRSAIGVIEAVSTGNGNVNLTLTGTASLQGSGTAVKASSSGTGEVNVITVQVDAKHSDATAVDAQGSGTRVYVNTNGTVEGGKYGITAVNRAKGTGTVTVLASRAVTVSSRTAIYVKNDGTRGVTVSAASVNAGNSGIDIKNRNGGSIIVTLSGNVLTRNVLRNGAGVSTVNDDAGNGIVITSTGVSTIRGGLGVNVYNPGTGDVSVTSNGEIRGTQKQGLYVQNRGRRTDVTVKSVYGATVGLDVGHNGTDSARIEISSDGIVTGEEIGLRLMAKSSGKIEIYASGAITGIRSDGLFASHRGNSDIKLNLTDVTGGSDGVQVVKLGSGSIDIDATGSIKATGNNSKDGIYVGHSGNGNVSITVSTVTGGTDGIDLRNFAGGTVTIIANSAVTANGSGEVDSGIFLYNDASGDSVSISAGSGGSFKGNNGVWVEDKSDALLSITAIGNFTGVGGNGVYIDKTGSGSVLMNVGQVTGKKRGIFVSHTGSGAVTITATKLVRSTNDSGAFSAIEIYNSGNQISLDLAGVTGNKHGVDTRTVETGSISIVNSGAVNSRNDGIRAFVEGQGDVSITVSGDIKAGERGVGINTKATNGTTTIIANGGKIEGGTAIKNLAGSSSVTINNDAELAGDVRLGAGVDQLKIYSTKFNSSVLLDGGEDASIDRSIDILTFGSGKTTAVVANLKNWERILIADGATLNFSSSGTVVVDDLRVNGTLSVQDGDVDDQLNITGNLSTVGDNITGTILLDVNFATGVTDTITVQGSMTGEKFLDVRDITPSDTSDRYQNPVNLITVGGNVVEDALTLNRPRVRSGDYVYTLGYDANSKSYRLIGKPAVPSCQGTASTGNFSCAGIIDGAEKIKGSVKQTVSASLAKTATVSVSADVAVAISGDDAPVVFMQETNGGNLTASGTASGVIVASTSGSGSVSVHLTGTATLAGSGSAVKASTTGTGNVTVKVASVVASNSSGIAVEVESGGGQVSVDVNTASGGRNGVVAKSTGTTGSISIKATGKISGGESGINAKTNNGNISVDAASVTGGIVASNDGSSGNVAASGKEYLGTGLLAVGGVSSDGVGNSATSKHVSQVVNNGSSVGSGNINITLSGTVTGGKQGVAIDTFTAGGRTNITLDSGAMISSNVAIRNDEGNSEVIVKSGATVSGDVRLGAGIDLLTFYQPTLGNSILDGGNDSGRSQSIDVLTFNGGSFSASMTEERWLNWEKIVVGSQATISFSGDDNQVNTTDFDLKGTVSLQNGEVEDGVTFDSNLIGGGTIKLDANFYTGSADVVHIRKNVTGVTKLDIRDLAKQNGGKEFEPIVIINVSGTVSASAFEMLESAQLPGNSGYELIFNDADKTFSVNRMLPAGSEMLVATPISLFDGYARAPTLHERRPENSDDPYWSRAYSRSNVYGTVGEGSSEYASSNTGIQVGYDLFTTTSHFGTLVYGATIQLGRTEVDVVALNVPGIYSAKGFGIGGTATLYTENGTYIDTQIQINQISADFEIGSRLGLRLNSHESKTILLSTEVGRRLMINNEYTLIYSAQLSWGNLDGGSAKTARNQVVDFGGDSNLTFRGGSRLSYSSGKSEIYGLANLYFDTLDSWDVSFASETYSDSRGAIAAEFGLGGQVELSQTSVLFGEATIKTSLSGGIEKWDSSYISTGIRWSW